VVLSAGWANRFGFPDLRVLARLERAGATVYRTDRDGAVVLRGRGAEGYVIETGRATDVDSPGGGVYRFESDRGDASGIPERPLF
jgi:beta-lactamase superfamily II metal-dependent hydrolase